MDKQETWFFDDGNFMFVARGLFQKDDLRQLREAVLQKRSSVGLPDERAKGQDALGIACDNVRLDPAWFKPFERANLEKYRKLVPRFDHITYPPMIRTVRDERSFVPWHQDSYYIGEARGIGGHTEAIICFVPLNEDPNQHPLLEFYLDPKQGVIRHIVREGFTYNRFDLAPEDYPPPEKCLRFPMELGDAFVFGMNTLHRTYAPVSPFDPRHSMEFRITSSTAAIDGKDYYNLSTQRFYTKGNS